MAGCTGKLAKCLLIFFNVIFLITGITVLCVGIWLRVDPDVVELQNLVNLDKHNPNLALAAYILIAFGGIVLLVAVFGFCAGIQESRCLLGLYIACLVIVFVGEFAAGILAVVYKNDVEITIEHRLKNVLKNDYKVGSSKYTRPWDFVQVWLECCGVNNYTDYRDVSFPPNQSVPKSCCKLNNDDPTDPEPKDNDKCQEEAKTTTITGYLQRSGCIDSVTNKIEEYDIVIISVAICIAFVQVFGVVLACCVCRNIKETSIN